jgi:hypothetical protein
VRLLDARAKKRGKIWFSLQLACRATSLATLLLLILPVAVSFPHVDIFAIELVRSSRRQRPELAVLAQLRRKRRQPAFESGGAASACDVPIFASERVLQRKQRVLYVLSLDDFAQSCIKIRLMRRQLLARHFKFRAC